MSRKILIVDDDQKTRTLLKTYLEKQQYEVALSRVFTMHQSGPAERQRKPTASINS